MFQWTRACGYLFENLFSFHLDIYPQVRFLDNFWLFNFYFLRNLHTLFHSGYTNLHSRQQWTSVLLSPHSCWHLLFLSFLPTLILTVWGDIALWFWFAFPWWLVMLSNFLLYSGHLNIFLEKMSSSSAQFLIGLLEFSYFRVVWVFISFGC